MPKRLKRAKKKQNRGDKNAPRKKVLVAGRIKKKDFSEISPFEKNQIRWALHCYRWLKGEKWTTYPDTIRQTLNIEFGDGLNTRDPYNWLIQEDDPTPEKLHIFKKFIEIAAPNYAKAFTDDGMNFQTASLLSRFYIPRKNDSEEFDSLSLMAKKLEQYVMICSAIDEMNPNIQVVPHFHAQNVIMAFRQLGTSPYVKMYMFGCDALAKVKLWLSDDQAEIERAVHKAVKDLKRQIQKEKMDLVDAFPMSHPHTGFLTFTNGKAHVANLKTSKHLSSVLSLPVGLDEYGQLGLVDDINDLGYRLFAPIITANENMISSINFQLYMLKVDLLQHYVATMK